jgi:cytochrome c oxidase cbb3-type subunit 3
MRKWLLVLAAPLVMAQMPTGPEAIEAGRQIYMGSCSGCHGAGGAGSQGPSLLSGRASRLADKALFGAIQNGLPGTTMPAFPMGEEKVWQVAAFVRSLTAPAARVRVAGDAARGQDHFFGAGKCAACHMIGGRGGYPGPDLSNVGGERTVAELREALTQPSRRIADGYVAVRATTKEGRVIAGVAKNYNNYSAQVVDRTGKLHLLDRGALASFTVLEGSMMPAVTDAEVVRDLVAFLAGQSVRKEEGAAR